MDVLESLAKARWEIAYRTYGNNHNSLIGIMVDWWISSNPAHSALEGPFSCNPGYCDAIFCRDLKAVGILEVEGTDPTTKFRRMGQYFRSQEERSRHFEFGLALLYTTKPSGRSPSKSFRNPLSDKSLAAAMEASKENPDKDIFILTLEKRWDDLLAKTWKSDAHYYSGKLHCVSAGYWLRNGEIREVKTRELWRPPAIPAAFSL